jgi:hypothetical protein
VIDFTLGLESMCCALYETGGHETSEEEEREEREETDSDGLI